ncbi:MAG: hypothetical protein ACLUDU_09075 [Butyricimonas faecihominis]
MKAAGEDIVSYQTRHDECGRLPCGRLWEIAEMKAQKEMEKYVNLLKEGTGVCRTRRAEPGADPCLLGKRSC